MVYKIVFASAPRESHFMCLDCVSQFGNLTVLSVTPAHGSLCQGCGYAWRRSEYWPKMKRATPAL